MQWKEADVNAHRKILGKGLHWKVLLLCSHTLSSRVLGNDKSSLWDGKDDEWDAKINLILERNLIVFRLCYLVYQKWGWGRVMSEEFLKN